MILLYVIAVLVGGLIGVYFYNLNLVHWDEQSILSLSGNYTELAYNVTAVAQNTANGYGAGYMLNGVTDKGDWYQFGLSWNWTKQSSTVKFNGFRKLYEVFKGPKTLYPIGGAGADVINGTINNGDKVLLKMRLVNGSVIMELYDWNTGAKANLSYAAFNATKFVGYGGNVVNEGHSVNGYFTGLMTEQTFRDANLTNGKRVSYQLGNQSLQPKSATMEIAEKCVSWIPFGCGSVGFYQAIFKGTSVITYNSDELQVLTVDNGYLASNATTFITGK